MTRSTRDIGELKPDLDEGLHDRRQLQQAPVQAPPWHMDDEKLVYPAYEKFHKAGLINVCVHKGLCSRRKIEKRSRTCSRTPTVRDVGKAAKGLAAAPLDPPGLLELGAPSTALPPPGRTVAAVIDDEVELRPVLGRLADVAHVGVREQVRELLSISGGNRPLWTQTLINPALWNFS